MQIRKASKFDVKNIAKLALMAGEGIPAWFWQQSAEPGQPIEDVGANRLLSENGNFSYRNVQIAGLDDNIAGMMLAYRLADADNAEDLNQLPAFIRPLVELEQCVACSFYINMIATYPQYRNRAVGSSLIGIVDQLAADAGCALTSIEVFDQNEGALRLYQRPGFSIIEKRRVAPHPSQPYDGYILLLTRTVENT